MLNVNAAVAPQAALPESPYRGIESFRYVDQPIFFARGEETRQLLRYVSVYRGVLFYGESGCGKSSLLNAGFIPAIIAEGFTPDRLRVQPKPGEEIVIERISMTVTGEPPYLPSNFIGSQDSAARIVLATDKVKERLRELLVSSPASRPILIFDQFEEFTTLFEEAPRGEGIEHAQQAQQAILKLIIELQRDATLPVKLLFSFREDYLAKLSKLISLWPDLSDQSQRLTPPPINSLPRIIRGSFEKFPGSFGKELSPELTNELSTAIQQRNEGGKLNLSEVQIACVQLWKSDDPEELFQSKGVQGLLEDYLSDSINRLPAELCDPAIGLLSRMVTPSGTRNIVSEYDLISQVQEDEGIPEERLKNALHVLVQDTKLVRRERRYDTYFYDIVSEFLVPWIRRQKIERQAALERQNLEAIGSRKRRKIIMTAAVVLTLTVAIGLAVFFYQRQEAYARILQTTEVKRAHAAEEEARQQALKARESEIYAQQLAAVAVEQKQQAETARKAAEDAKVKAETDLSKLDKSLKDANLEKSAAGKEASDARGELRATLSTIVQLCDRLGSQNNSPQAPRPRQESDLNAKCREIATRVSNTERRLEKVSRLWAF